MTKSAIEILRKNENGFVLFVEGGRIDHAHHDNMAHHAMEGQFYKNVKKYILTKYFTETEELAKAVTTALEMTNDDETLIVVTADHSHTMTMSGYSKRGEDILGFNTQKSDVDSTNYLTLQYANGPSGMKDRKEINVDDMSEYEKNCGDFG
jgi:alkaline phosphatase